MPDLQLMPLLVLSGTLVVAGASLIAYGNRVNEPAAVQSPSLSRAALLWGCVLMAEGVGQLMFWFWSADTGYGQPASNAFMLTVLAALLLPPLVYGAWRTRRPPSARVLEFHQAGSGSLDLAYGLAGAAIAIALTTIVLQWELERLGGAWIQVAHHSPGYHVPADDLAAQILVHSLLRFVTIIRFSGGLAFSMSVLALAVSNRRAASARWLAGAGVALAVGAIWTHWLWLEHLRWS